MSEYSESDSLPNRIDIDYSGSDNDYDSEDCSVVYDNDSDCNAVDVVDTKANTIEIGGITIHESNIKIKYYIEKIHSIVNSLDKSDMELKKSILNILNLNKDVRKNYELIHSIIKDNDIADAVYIVTYDKNLQEETNKILINNTFTLEQILSDKTIYKVRDYDSPELIERFNMKILPKYTHFEFNPRNTFTLDTFNSIINYYDLDGFDFSHIVIAGGCFYESEDSDIDMFIVGGEEHKNDAIKAFVEYFNDRDYIITSTTINCIYNGRKIQLVLRVYDNVQQILDSFDIGPACIYYDGIDVYANAECIYSILSNNIIINKDRIRTNYTNRLTKYIRNKKFNILFVDNISDQIYTINTNSKFLCKVISLKPFMIIYDKVPVLSNNPICTIDSFYNFINNYYPLEIDEFMLSLNFANRIGKVDFLSRITPNFSSANDYYSSLSDIPCFKNINSNITIKYDIVSTKLNSKTLKKFIHSGKKKIRIFPQDNKKLSNIIDLYIAFEHYKSDFYSKKNPLMGLNSLF